MIEKDENKKRDNSPRRLVRRRGSWKGDDEWSGSRWLSDFLKHIELAFAWFVINRGGYFDRPVVERWFGVCVRQANYVLRRLLDIGAIAPVRNAGNAAVIYRFERPVYHLLGETSTNLTRSHGFWFQLASVALSELFGGSTEREIITLIDRRNRVEYLANECGISQGAIPGLPRSCNPSRRRSYEPINEEIAVDRLEPGNVWVVYLTGSDSFPVKPVEWFISRWSKAMAMNSRLGYMIVITTREAYQFLSARYPLGETELDLPGYMETPRRRAPVRLVMCTQAYDRHTVMGRYKWLPLNR